MLKLTLENIDSIDFSDDNIHSVAIVEPVNLALKLQFENCKTEFHENIYDQWYDAVTVKWNCLSNLSEGNHILIIHKSDFEDKNENA